jgi:hypothetical protein
MTLKMWGHGDRFCDQYFFEAQECRWILYVCWLKVMHVCDPRACILSVRSKSMRFGCVISYRYQRKHGHTTEGMLICEVR